MALQEGRHELLEPPRRRGAERAERHSPAAHRRELADAARGVLERAQAVGGVLGEGVAGVGREHAAAGADEQVGAERALELADLLRDGGLGDAQRLGRGAERSELERGAEAADLLERQKLSLWTPPSNQPSLGAARPMMRAMEIRDVVVIGGGIAGLAAAWRLRDRDVLLLEAQDRLGGRLRSDPRGDYWLNYGAHLFPAPGSLVDSPGPRLRPRDRSGDRQHDGPGRRLQLLNHGRAGANDRVRSAAAGIPQHFRQGELSMSAMQSTSRHRCGGRCSRLVAICGCRPPGKYQMKH